MSRIPNAECPAELQATMQNNLHRTLYNNADIADAFGILARGVHTASHLPHRIRELCILRIASLLQADVEWAQHFKIAQMVGISVEEARAIRDGKLSEFTAAEQAAINFAVAVEQRSVSDALWAATAEHYTPVQLLDLAMLAGLYGYASRITLALGVEVDAGLTRLAES
jgi:alkylhydroperoxidase family enzyme